MPNDDVMHILLKKDNFKDLSYENGILSYQGKKINLKKIYLTDFLNSYYSPLYTNMDLLTSEDIFNIFDIHTKDIESYDMNDLANIALNNLTNQQQTNIIISPKHYFEIINSNQFNASTNKQIQDFETFVYECMRYGDYLQPKQKKFVDDYYYTIQEMKENLQKNPNQKYTIGEQHAIEKSDQIDKSVKEFITEKANIRIRKPNQNINTSFGYANAFIVILSTIATGIVAALVLYFSIK